MSDLQVLLDDMSNDCVLNDVYEIEDVLLLIQEVNNKVDFYKSLRARRIKSIDSEINNLSQKITMLRQVILNTMIKIVPNDKSLNFPSIGKISRRKGSESYQIEDQDQVISFLDSKGMKAEVVRTEEIIDKRKLKTLIKQFQTTGDNIPGIKKVTGSESLSITFDKTEPKSSSTPIRGIEIEDLDMLTV